MRCSACGMENPPDTKFCMNCGTKQEVAAPAAGPSAFCPQCGSQIAAGSQFCNNCGARLVITCPRCGTEAASGQRFCNTCGNDLSQGTSLRVAGPAPRAGHRARIGFSLRPSAVVAGIGAILMLISMGIAWYTVRWASGVSSDISAGDLLDTLSEQGTGEPLWAGMGLPIVLIIVASCIVLFSVIYSVLKGKITRALWILLGDLAILCVLGNAGYFLYWLYDQTDEVYNIAAAGSVLALIGAFLELGGGMFSRSRQ